MASGSNWASLFCRTPATNRSLAAPSESKLTNKTRGDFAYFRTARCQAVYASRRLRLREIEGGSLLYRLHDEIVLMGSRSGIIVKRPALI